MFFNEVVMRQIDNSISKLLFQPGFLNT